MIQTEVTPNKKGTLVKVLIVCAFVFAGLFCAYKLGVAASQNPQATNIENVFSDVNGDGKLDLIVSGVVILNTEQNSNFLASQLSQ